jgi:hypothetical protein
VSGGPTLSGVVMGLRRFGSGKRMRLAIWTLASLALAGVPQARAAEPDNATLLQEIRALKEVVRDLVQTVRELERRVTVLEGRAPATASAPPAKAANSQAPLPAAPTAAGTMVTPGTPQVAPSVPQAAAAGPEAATTAPRAAPVGTGGPYVSPEALLKANWSKIRADMDASEVTNLLGPPSTKFTLGARTVWYYYYPATGRGSVFFTDAGRVTSLQSPFGWWDW